MNPITEIVSDWEAGTYSVHDAFQALLELAADSPIDMIVAALPAGIDGEFTAWLRATYDNDTPAGDVVRVGPRRTDDAEHQRIVARALAWLAKGSA